MAAERGAGQQQSQEMMEGERPLRAPGVADGGSGPARLLAREDLGVRPPIQRPSPDSCPPVSAGRGRLGPGPRPGDDSDQTTGVEGRGGRGARGQGPGADGDVGRWEPPSERRRLTGGEGEALC